MHGQKKLICGSICLFFADEMISEVVLKSAVLFCCLQFVIVVFPDHTHLLFL